MKKFFVNIFKNAGRGFSLVEIIVSLAIFSVILLVVISSLQSMNNSNLRTKANGETSESAQRVLDEIVYEIRSAKSIYTPTTTTNQLSLETSRYLPSGESNTFIDFFLCGSAVCLKKESQDPIALTSNAVNVTSLVFSQILTGTSPSIKVDLTLNYLNPSNDNFSSSTINLTSTATLRSY